MLYSHTSPKYKSNHRPTLNYRIPDLPDITKPDDDQEANAKIV